MPLSPESIRDGLVCAGNYAGLQLELVPEPILSATAAEVELEAVADVSTLGVYYLGGRSFTFSVLRQQSARRVWVC